MKIDFVVDDVSGDCEIDADLAERQRHDGQTLAASVARQVAERMHDTPPTSAGAIDLRIVAPARFAGSYRVAYAPYTTRGRSGVGYYPHEFDVEAQKTRIERGDAVLRALAADQVYGAFDTILTNYGDRVAIAPHLTSDEWNQVDDLALLYDHGILHDVGSLVRFKGDGTIGVLVQETLDRGVAPPDNDAMRTFEERTGHVPLLHPTEAWGGTNVFCCYLRADPAIDLEALATVQEEIRQALSPKAVPRASPTL